MPLVSRRSKTQTLRQSRLRPFACWASGICAMIMRPCLTTNHARNHRLKQYGAGPASAFFGLRAPTEAGTKNCRTLNFWRAIFPNLVQGDYYPRSHLAVRVSRSNQFAAEVSPTLACSRCSSPAYPTKKPAGNSMPSAVEGNDAQQIT